MSRLLIFAAWLMPMPLLQLAAAVRITLEYRQKRQEARQ